MESKRWYESKLVWTGVFQTIVGVAELLAVFFETGDFCTSAFMLLISGIATVILRVWLTTSTISR